MADAFIEFVVANDCACDGVAFLRGETRKVPKSTYRELVAAGRVCMDDGAIDGAKADAARRRAASKAAKGGALADRDSAGDQKLPTP